MMMIPRKDWGMSLFDDMFDDPFLKKFKKRALTYENRYCRKRW